MKRIIRRILPSYRAAAQTDGRLDLMESRITVTLLKRIKDLDYKYEYLFWLTQQLVGEKDLDTKKRIFLDLPKAVGTLRDIQLAESFLLQRIKKHTDDLDIRFFLMGGTALGAIRHKGFIPWDDDVDIGMLNDDCEKLIQRVNENDKLISILRYYDYNGCSMIKVKFVFSENFYIDIFPFDRVRLDSSKINDYKTELWSLTQNYTKEIAKRIETNDSLEPFIRPIFLPNLDSYAKNYYKEIMDELKCFNGEDIYIHESAINGYDFLSSREIWRQEEVFPFMIDEVEFEGIKYDMIKDYREKLETFLGDIWSFPQNLRAIHSAEFDAKIEEDIEHLRFLRII